jgi:hypothetical protein
MWVCVGGCVEYSDHVVNADTHSLSRQESDITYAPSAIMRAATPLLLQQRPRPLPLTLRLHRCGPVQRVASTN